MPLVSIHCRGKDCAKPSKRSNEKWRVPSEGRKDTPLILWQFVEGQLLDNVLREMFSVNRFAGGEHIAEQLVKLLVSYPLQCRKQPGIKKVKLNRSPSETDGLGPQNCVRIPFVAIRMKSSAEMFRCNLFDKRRRTSGRALVLPIAPSRERWSSLNNVSRLGE